MTHKQHTTLPPILQSNHIVVRGIRWLIRADVPVPARSEAQLKSQVERDYVWNFWVNLLDGLSFLIGISFASSSTIFPLFVSKLTTNPLVIGLLGVISQAGWFLPQLFTANVVQQLPRKKPIVTNLGLFLERLPFLVMIAAAAIAASAPTLALILFLIAYGWHVVGAGVVATAWQDLIANCFPVARRGRFFGLTNSLGTGAGVIGAAISARILDAAPFPTNFVYSFVIATAFIFLSLAFLLMTREPVAPITTPPKSDREFWSQLPAILKDDHNFRRFFVARLMMALGGMGGGFLTVAAVQRWQLSDSVVGFYTAEMLVGQTVGNLLFGFLADRFGHKLSMVVGPAAGALAFAIAGLAQDPAWFYLVFGLQGIMFGAVIVSGILIVMEFSEPAQRPTYVGLMNTGTGVAGAVAPLIGAWLAAQGYTALFAVTAVVYVAALLLMAFWVKEPRQLARSEGA